MAFEDITWLQGKQNVAGLVGDVYFVPIDDVDDTQLPAIGTAGDLNVSNAIVLAANKKWFKVYHTPETGKIDSNSVGEVDGMSVDNVLEFFVPGNDETLAKFKRQILNTRALWLAKDTDGNYRILGLSVLDPAGTATSLDLPAHCIQANTTTGAARADRRGVTFQVTFKAPHDALIYSGTIDVDDAT